MIDAAGHTIIPVWKLGILALLPIPLLFILSITSTEKISTRWKQIISVPLLTSLLFIPYNYCDAENGSFSVFCQVIPFIMFLRFLDIFWISPLLYKKKAFIEPSELSVELWSCIRKNLKPHHKKKEDSSLTHDDKKFYHLVLPIVLNAVVFDTLAAWVKTFMAEDISTLFKTVSVQSVLFVWAVVSALMCLLNFAGLVMQLMYCVFVGGGTYRSSDWRLMMNYPLLGLSLEDVWSIRWHRIFRPAWISSAYKPIYFLIRESTHNTPRFKPLAIGVASMAVFVVSGMTHEFAVLCNTGWPLYKEKFMGDQIKFFCTHGLLVVLERSVSYVYTHVLKRRPMDSWIIRLFLHTYVLSVCYFTFPLFLNGFAHWGLWKLDRITPVENWVQQYILKPYFNSYCGSRLNLT